MSSGVSPLPRWKRVLFALLPSLLLLGAAELVLYLALADTDIRTPLGRGGLLRPYVPGSEADLVSSEFRVRYAINEWGFRDLGGRPLASPASPPPPYRILLLGDSFTEGYGVELEDTYARRLEETGPFEVWNLGRMGASPLFYVLQAREYLPKLAPDVLVVQLFDNDLDENRYRHVERDAEGRVVGIPDALRPGQGLVAELRDWYGQRALVQAWRRLRRRLSGKLVPRLFVRPWRDVVRDAPPTQASGERLFPWYDAQAASAWDAKLREQEVLLRQLVAEVRDAGVPLVLGYVPHGRELRGGGVNALRDANPHYRMLARVCGELEVTMIDGIALFASGDRDPESFYFSRDQHWNPTGHASFAEALAAVLRDLIPVRGAST